MCSTQLINNNKINNRIYESRNTGREEVSSEATVTVLAQGNISPAEHGGNDNMTGVLKLQVSRLSDKLYTHA